MTITSIIVDPLCPTPRNFPASQGFVNASPGPKHVETPADHVIHQIRILLASSRKLYIIAASFDTT